MSDNILVSMRQASTPLNTVYFSEFNVNLLQKTIRTQFKKQTNISIDYQNEADLLAIMRAVFINNATNQPTGVCEQVRKMNTVVINTALAQIHTGVSQYMDYNKEIKSTLQLLPNPVNTSTHGTKM
jgi:hypothetical protein